MTSNLTTTLKSNGSREQIQAILTQLQNPNLTQDQYNQARYQFIKLNESYSAKAVNVGDGKMTVGVALW